MNAWRLLLLAVVMASVSCRQSSAPMTDQPKPSPVSSPTPAAIPDLTSASETEWHEHLGKTVTIQGKFASWGLVGPLIQVGDRTFNLEPGGSYNFGKEYKRMEGKQVRITGVWRFRHFEPSSGQHPYDYFYIEVETAKVELVK
jgi:hypothetical protein